MWELLRSGRSPVASAARGPSNCGLWFAIPFGAGFGAGSCKTLDPVASAVGEVIQRHLILGRTITFGSGFGAGST